MNKSVEAGHVVGENPEEQILKDARYFNNTIDRFDVNSNNPRTELVRLTAEESEIPFQTHRIGASGEPMVLAISSVLNQDIKVLIEMPNTDLDECLGKELKVWAGVSLVEEPRKTELTLQVTAELRRALDAVLQRHAKEWAPEIEQPTT